MTSQADGAPSGLPQRSAACRPGNELDDRPSAIGRL